MKDIGESFFFVMERSTDTWATALLLTQPPTSWEYPPATPEELNFRRTALREQDTALISAENRALNAGGEWDLAIQAVHADVSYGLQAARLHLKEQPVKVALFAGLRLNNTGRESRLQQALEFEIAWRKADAAWVFKEGVTLADFRARRLALRDLEEEHMVAVKDETEARASLHEQAGALNDLCMDWYEMATLHFPAETVAGSVVRTIPTTYDANRAPGPLVFTRAESPAAGGAALRFRAPRGVKFFLEGLAPGASEWTKLLDGAEVNAWTGEGLAGGHWKFRGRASNRFGDGTVSEPVEVAVASAKAA